ncbi:MAG TPA: head GIN domain-containing protein [Chitinophagaceae bacterium]|nr:head GIN domain-containing protein [Chitinophagaceae bacterium]
MKATLLFFAFIATLFTSCHMFGGKRIRGNGTMKTETRSAGSFTNVDVTGSFEVYVKQDSVSSVRVEADENLMEYIIIQTEGNTLRIKTKDGANLKSTNGLKVYVSNPSYKDFDASGACDIQSENKITSADVVSIGLSGASSVKLEVSAPGITVEGSGASTVSLSGTTKEFDVDGSGSTNIKCYDLLSENTTVGLSGAGDAQVYASVKLDVDISGAADVKYKGNAAVTQSISGAGSVRKIN